MSDVRLLDLLRLNAVPLFSPDRIREALKRHGAHELLERPLLGERFSSVARAFDAEDELARCRQKEIRVLPWDHPHYPAALRNVPDAPLLLYALGRVEAPAPAAAVVGARACSAYGRRMARLFGGGLAEAGALVVSGLARGIDAEAHDAALAAGGQTWAVLGCGLARIYPPENEPLARRIVEGGGCLLSELPLDAAPSKPQFPRRNRIVAGLSWATVVVEGRHGSGSLITAHAAAELGRKVFAVPGPADSPWSQGPHELLRTGADVALEPNDVMAEAPAGCAPLRLGRAHAEAGYSLSLEYRKIVECLSGDALTVDELSLKTGLAVSRLSTILFEMELQGTVFPWPGQRYGKKSPY